MLKFQTVRMDRSETKKEKELEDMINESRDVARRASVVGSPTKAQFSRLNQS